MKRANASEMVQRYHQQTKHRLDRPANSLGYMDWKNQPIPFRSYQGAAQIQLPLLKKDNVLPYQALYEANTQPVSPISLTSIATMLELSMGLSQWKKYDTSQWALRMNPSSGNLHPTECYLLLPTFSSRPACLTHYQPYLHALEEIAIFDQAQTQSLTEIGGFGLLLTSITWREAWKYGERAYRYCQHDLGHALATLRVACNLNGWKMSIIPQVDSQTLDDFLDLDKIPGEEEVAECMCWIAVDGIDSQSVSDWFIKQKILNYRHMPNQLSTDHIDWPIIRQVQQAAQSYQHTNVDKVLLTKPPTDNLTSCYSAQAIIRKRRSAQSYDQAQSILNLNTFVHMLIRTLPNNTCPFDVFPYCPETHLVIFVHAVQGIPPGLYILIRNAQHHELIKAQCAQHFLWQSVHTELPLYLLQEGDFRKIAQDISCNQAIAGESAFSLGMIAQFSDVISAQPSSYPRLFWETGLIGQVLYLEAEAFDLRGTGIGCFFDDQMHQLLGLQTDKWQSLYHFTVGKAREDTRIEVKPPYSHLQR